MPQPHRAPLHDRRLRAHTSYDAAARLHTLPPLAELLDVQVVVTTTRSAAMLASAEDLAGDCDANLADDACVDSETDSETNDGIVSWTVKYVDKALDDIERERPAAAQSAWRLNKAGERVVSNPTVRRGAKLTADVSLEVLKVGVKAAAPVVGGIGKFAAKQAFGAAVSGLKNPLDPKGDAEAKAKNAEPARDGEKKKKKIVKLTAAEAEARRKAGKTVRKVEKKKGGFFGL